MIHRLDPRTKLLATALVFALVLVFNDPRYLAGVLAAVIVAALLAGPAAKTLFRIASGLTPVVLATFVLWPLFVHQGTPLLRWHWLEVTDVGLLYAAAMAERIVVPCLAALLLFITTRRRDVVTGLVRLGLPYQVGFGVTIAFGFIPNLVGIGQTIVQAQRARGLSIGKGGPGTRLRKSASLIVPLLITALASVQNLAFSMDSRGYGARAVRTYLHPLHLSGLDRALLVLEAVLLPLGMVWRLLGHGVVLTGGL